MAKDKHGKKSLRFRILLDFVLILATIYGLWWGGEWILRNFHWFSTQKWGDVEYVVASIGVNMALVGWKGFRDQLKKIWVDIEQKTASFETYMLDRPEIAAKAQGTFFRYSSIAIWTLDFFWRVAPLFAVLLVGLGMFALYTEWYCPWLIIMMLPIPVYLLLGLLALLWIRLIYHWNFMALHSQGPGDINTSIKNFKKGLDLGD